MAYACPYFKSESEGNAHKTFAGRQSYAKLKKQWKVNNKQTSWCSLGWDGHMTFKSSH